MNGILLVDKPKGWTSFDVVAKLRSAVRLSTGQKRPKVGHAGTLDPLATGLMIILLGDECKNADRYLKLEKSYEFTAKLGAISSTGDLEGELTSVSDIQPSLTEVEAILGKFVGKLEQTPPIYSAIKINGQRAYKLARAGKSIEMPKRQITINQLNLLKYDYPILKCTCNVSSGTYIRTLAEDIGKTLKTGAYLTELKRESIGEYKLINSKKIDDNQLLKNLLI